MKDNENKKSQVIIIGAGPEDKMGAGRIALLIADLEKKHEVIFVDSIEKARDLTGLDLELGKMPTLVVDDMKQKTFENPPIPFKRYEVEMPPRIDFMDMQEHNPWPSPKGRKGKRRW